MINCFNPVSTILFTFRNHYARSLTLNLSWSQDIFDSLTIWKNQLNVLWRFSSSLVLSYIGFLLSKFKKQSIDQMIIDKAKIHNSRVYSLSEQESWKISLCKTNQLEIHFFEEEELEAILNLVCTDWLVGVGVIEFSSIHMTAPPLTRNNIVFNKIDLTVQHVQVGNKSSHNPLW